MTVLGLIIDRSRFFFVSTSIDHESSKDFGKKCKPHCPTNKTKISPHANVRSFAILDCVEKTTTTVITMSIPSVSIRKNTDKKK